MRTRRARETIRAPISASLGRRKRAYRLLQVQDAPCSCMPHTKSGAVDAVLQRHRSTRIGASIRWTTYRHHRRRRRRRRRRGAPVASSCQAPHDPTPFVRIGLANFTPRHRAALGNNHTGTVPTGYQRYRACLAYRYTAMPSADAPRICLRPEICLCLFTPLPRLAFAPSCSATWTTTGNWTW